MQSDGITTLLFADPHEVAVADELVLTSPGLRLVLATPIHRLELPDTFDVTGHRIALRVRALRRHLLGVHGTGKEQRADGECENAMSRTHRCPPLIGVKRVYDRLFPSASKGRFELLARSSSASSAASCRTSWSSCAATRDQRPTSEGLV